MTKKYIDFAPKNRSRGTGAPVKKAVVAEKKVTTARTVVRRPAATRPTVTKSTVNVKAKPAGVKLGEIEDLNPKFVMTNVPKRALGGTQATTVTATMAKARKVGNQAKTVKTAKKVETPDKMKLVNEKQRTYTVPKATFINQDKVAKRPLSRNVYKKQLDALEKASKGSNGKGGTVKIISKPEKDSKVGVVVTIVLTIILGAVAGTVAFLLLPK